MSIGKTFRIENGDEMLDEIFKSLRYVLDNCSNFLCSCILLFREGGKTEEDAFGIVEVAISKLKKSIDKRNRDKGAAAASSNAGLWAPPPFTGRKTS